MYYLAIANEFDASECSLIGRDAYIDFHLGRLVGLNGGSKSLTVDIESGAKLHTGGGEGAACAECIEDGFARQLLGPDSGETRSIDISLPAHSVLPGEPVLIRTSCKSESYAAGETIANERAGDSSPMGYRGIPFILEGSMYRADLDGRYDFVVPCFPFHSGPANVVGDHDGLMGTCGADELWQITEAFILVVEEGNGGVGRVYNEMAPSMFCIDSRACPFLTKESGELFGRIVMIGDVLLLLPFAIKQAFAYEVVMVGKDMEVVSKDVASSQVGLIGISHAVALPGMAVNVAEVKVEPRRIVLTVLVGGLGPNDARLNSLQRLL